MNIKWKRKRKGKEYYFDGKLKFEGEYLNGKRNGKGKHYYKNGNFEYEGEYLNEKGKNIIIIMKMVILNIKVNI